MNLSQKTRTGSFRRTMTPNIAVGSEQTGNAKMMTSAWISLQIRFKMFGFTLSGSFEKNVYYLWSSFEEYFGALNMLKIWWKVCLGDTKRLKKLEEIGLLCILFGDQILYIGSIVSANDRPQLDVVRRVNIVQILLFCSKPETADILTQTSS